MIGRGVHIYIYIYIYMSVVDGSISSINAKIEDVGLNEIKKVQKQEMVTKFS